MYLLPLYCSNAECAASSKDTWSKESAVLFLHGPYGVGKQAVAEAICNALQRPLLVADMSQVSQGDRDITTPFALLRREAILQGAGLYLAHFKTLLADDEATTRQPQALIRALTQPTFPVFLRSDAPWHPVGAWSQTRFIDVELPVPDFPLRLQPWQQAVGNLKQQGFAGISDEDITMLANQFVPIAADESAYSAANAAHLIAMGAVNVVNIKLMKSGFVEALDIAAVCRATHIQLINGGTQHNALKLDVLITPG